LKVALIGAGAWGSTLADLAKDNGHQVEVWSRQSSCSLEQVTDGADLVVSAISMKGVRDVVERLKSFSLSPDTILVTATK